MRRLLALAAISLLTEAAMGQLTFRPDIELPSLPDFRPLPASDEAFSDQLRPLVEAAGLDRMTPAAENVDNEDEWSSICLVDLSDLAHPRVAEWRGENMIYPASTYKLYVVGEAIREVCAGQLSLEQTFVVPEHNVREGDHIQASEEITLSELLRNVCQWSDNTAANQLIDIVDRQRASALLRAMGLEGSDITRKYLPRSLEDEGYAEVPGTVSCARHFATFLWAAETGAIGGGRGRGLIRAYLAMNQTSLPRMRAGLPDSATLLSKSGWWENFNAEVGIIEDGPVRYILCVMTAMQGEEADTRIADFTRRVHEMLWNLRQ